VGGQRSRGGDGSRAMGQKNSVFSSKLQHISPCRRLRKVPEGIEPCPGTAPDLAMSFGGDPRRAWARYAGGSCFFFSANQEPLPDEHSSPSAFPPGISGWDLGENFNAGPAGPKNNQKALGTAGWGARIRHFSNLDKDGPDSCPGEETRGWGVGVVFLPSVGGNLACWAFDIFRFFPASSFSQQQRHGGGRTPAGVPSPYSLFLAPSNALSPLEVTFPAVPPSPLEGNQPLRGSPFAATMKKSPGPLLGSPQGFGEVGDPAPSRLCSRALFFPLNIGRRPA